MGSSMVENAERQTGSTKRPKHVVDLYIGEIQQSSSASSRLLLDRTETERFEMVVVNWPKGSKGALETHQEKEQTFFVFSGSGIITISEEQALVKAGDLIFVPRNAPHTTEAKDEDLSYLCLNAYITEMGA